MQLFDLTGQVAIVTGASSGIGADAARGYAQAGASVALLARRKEKLEALASEISDNGGKAFAVQCDVSKEKQVQAAFDRIMTNLGKVDILLNNAGVAIRGSVDQIEEEDWDRSMNINVKGPYFMAKYAVPIMKSQKYGRIVNVSSVNAVLGDKAPDLVRHSYNASKSALVGLTKGMAASLMMWGITVNAIAPGLFETEMTENTLFKAEAFMQMYNNLCPAGRPGASGEMNGPILFFSSKACSYVTGQVLFVDGGLAGV